ncbi:MAG: hypothetical protein ACOCYC_02165 [bacterium]
MKLTKTILGSIVIVLLAAVLAGCPGLGLPGTLDSTEEEDAEPFEADPVAAQQAVDDGKASLEDGDYEAALDSFVEALQNDPSNGEALIYYSTLSLGQIATDPDLATITADYFGIKNYPTTLNEFLDFANWLSGTVVVTDDVTGDTVTTVTMLDALYPDIEIPESIATFDDTVDNITENEYLLGLAYNFVTRNPNGVNALTDDVVEEVLGSRLDSVVETIEDIPDDVEVTITPEVVFGPDNDTAAVDAGWPTDTDGTMPVDVTIGKEELLIETASLRAIQSRLYMAQAYSKALPLQNWWDELNPVDNGELYGALSQNDPDIPWGDLTTPFAAGFLFPREDTPEYLREAKSSFLSAVQNLQTAFEGILAGRPGMTLDGSSNIYLNPGSSGVQMIDWENDVEPGLAYQLALIRRIANSLLTGNLVALPTDAYNFSSPQDYFEYYRNHANWPDEPGKQEIDIDGETIEVPSAIGINFSVPYETLIGAVNFLLDMNEETGEPNYYDFSIGFDGNDVLVYAANENPAQSVTEIPNPYSDSNTFYALRIPDISLGGLYSLDLFLNDIRSAINMANQDPDGGVYINTPGGTTLADQLIVENPDGSVSAFLPAIPPFLANESFTDAGQTATVTYDYLELGTGETVTWATVGSFWWGLGNLGDLIYNEELAIEELIAQ